MADFDPNAGSFLHKEEAIGANSMPAHLPPSNMEIKIRTMTTDIESVKRGGGLLGLSEKISFSVPQEGSAAATNVPLSAEPEQKKKIGVYVVAGILGMGALFAVGYFLPLLIASKKVPPVVNPPVPPPAATTTTPVVPAPAPVTVVHASFFKTPADAYSSAVVAAGVAQPLEGWLQALRTATSGITEIVPSANGGASYSWLDFLTAIGISTANKDFFANNFESDFTVFVYGDKDGFWPGYILKLKAGESPLLLASGVVKIETDTALIYSFFTQAPGTASPAFRDAQLSGNPVRELTFTQKPSAFIYGWVKSQYLIIGTSEDGVKAAISRL